MIGQCLSELTQIYNGNKKLLMHATNHLFTISYVYVFINLFNLATFYHRVSCSLLPLWVVRRKFELIKEILIEDEDLWINGYQ